MTGLELLDSSYNLDNYDILGDSHSTATLDLQGVSTSMLVCKSIGVEGIINGEVHLDENCELKNITDFNGEAYNSEIEGTIVLGPGTKHEFVSCFQGTPASGIPIIDCNNELNINLSIGDYTGEILIKNVDSSNALISVHLNAGHLILDSTVVNAANIIVTGTGFITDNSDSSVIPDITGLTFGTSGLTMAESIQLASIDTLRKLMQNRMETDPVTGVMTIYDDDDSTPFLTGNIYEDVLATQLYRGRGIERRNRLT
jgi:hypothetical protein